MNRTVRLLQPPDEWVSALICPLTREHVEQIDDIWNGILREAEQPDAAWNWSYKLRLSLSEERYEAYGIELDEILHGVVLIETQWHCSWFSQAYRLVYVEYLSAAPWNRRPLEDPPYLKRVGSALLTIARQRSVELGYEGRVGLHALPGTEGFYDRLNMMDNGPDPEKEGLVYFEYAAM